MSSFSGKGNERDASGHAGKKLASGERVTVWRQGSVCVLGQQFVVVDVSGGRSSAV